jgi:hypothetical protein
VVGGRFLFRMIEAPINKNKEEIRRIREMKG